jgi:hypothetical protein
MKNVLVALGAVGLGLSVILLSAGTGDAATYYVDNNHASASDANPGTFDLPWLTIQHASETMVAGDTVLVRAGTYNEHVYTEHDGTSTEGFIVFSAYPGETPIIDGTGVQESQNGVIIDKCYIKLLGFEIQNWNENAIWVENVAHIEISDCDIHDVWYGVGLADGTYDFEINRVVAHDFVLYGFDVSPSGGAQCHDGTFNDCVAHSGSDPQQNVDGFALSHGEQYGFTFNRCETYEVYDGFDVGENLNNSQSNVTFNRCSAHECWNAGFKLWGDQVSVVNCLAYHCDNANVELDWGGNPGTTLLHSCTFMDAETFNIWVENSSDSLHMYNCIVAGSDNIGLCFEQQEANTYTGNYNIFHDDDGDMAISVGYEDEFTLGQIAAGDWTAYSGQDAHSLVVYSLDELFADPVSFDLHVLETSAAVDNGTPMDAPSEDYVGNPRPSGSGYDIGAYEYQFDASADDGAPDRFPGTYVVRSSPNPFDQAVVIAYFLPRASSIRLGIYDLSGQLVRSLLNGSRPAGSHQAVWDGCDDSGAREPAGLYVCRLESGGMTAAARVVLAR